MNIDHVAREMVNVEPSVDLEARIRARLDGVRPRRTADWWTWRVVMPVGAVATLALIVGVLGTRSPGVVTTVGVENNIGVQGTRGPEVVMASRLPKVSTSQLSAAASQLSSEDLAWLDRRFPSLDPLNALQLDRLHVDSIQPEPLTITPLIMMTLGADGAEVERRNDR